MFFSATESTDFNESPLNFHWHHLSGRLLSKLGGDTAFWHVANVTTCAIMYPRAQSPARFIKRESFSPWDRAHDPEYFLGVSDSHCRRSWPSSSLGILGKNFYFWELLPLLDDICSGYQAEKYCEQESSADGQGSEDPEAVNGKRWSRRDGWVFPFLKFFFTVSNFIIV